MIGPEHALISGLRTPASETELTRVLAHVFAHEPAMAASFVRLVVDSAPRGDGASASDLPSMLDCVSERALEEGRADLSFADADGRWHAIVELKIHAGYGPDQIARYLRSFDTRSTRRVLAAITRDVPTYGDYDGPDAEWLGSVQWARLLPGLRQLQPENDELARQWPLLLDVLESEGSMGFTQANPDLFKSWAGYYEARQHMIDFVELVRTPLLHALRDALRPDLPAGERANVAGFVGRGKRQVQVVHPRLGKVHVRFRIPADGPERVSAGVWGWGSPRFIVELPYPRTSESDAVQTSLRRLFDLGFEDWQRRSQVVWRYLDLDSGLLRDPALDSRVVDFAHESFGMIVESGILTADPGDAGFPVAEPEE